jgi:stringent starvation protein B
MSASATPQRPYLLRAMHEWMTDSGYTPHIVLDATAPGVDVPEQHVTDGKLILNVSYAAVRDLELGNEQISFEARFGGVPRRLCVPVAAVLGIYARETGQGMIFAADEDADSASADGADREPRPPGGRSHLKVVK